MSVVSFLQSQGVVSEAQAGQFAAAASGQGKTLEEVMLENGIDAEQLRLGIAAYYQVPSFTFNEDFTVSQDILKYVPEESAFHYGIMPLLVDEDGMLVIGTNDPENLQVRDVLNFIATKHNLPYKLVFMLARDIKKAHSFYSNLKSDVTDALGTLESELDTELIENAEAETEEVSKSAMEHIKEDAPVTKIVATILRYAVDGSASDIHIEPIEKKVVVRFRVDGMLQTSLELPKNAQLAVIARIKILSSMRLDERRKPQDGRFSATFDGRKIDFRVSILPTNYGEKVVMRILDNERGVRTLSDIGISGHILETIRRLIKEPYGIILISGPTGSGKSTTLYAMLSEVDRLGQNVLSLEDPVEYNIEGVSQSQVRPEIGYTFANGLRAALRQDPDIIMVGEIRDRETAQLAIQAALTGHLVLSTIHTNNSIGVIPRLIDMGVDPYLIAPTLKLAIAQRLARRIKPGTGKEEPVGQSMELMMEDVFETLPDKYRQRVPKNRTIMHPEPSPGSATGMKGRVAVMEALEVTDQIQSLILKNASEDEIYKAARAQGFMTMQEDAIIKALDHVIPYEEMNLFGSKIGIDAGEEVSEATEATGGSAVSMEDETAL